MPGERVVRIVRNPEPTVGGSVGRDVKARATPSGKKRRPPQRATGRSVRKTSSSGWLEQSFRKTHPLIGALQRHIVQKNTDLQNKRPTTHVHPSAACKADWCPRASWFEITGAEADTKRVGHQLANVFLEGHEIHDKYQTMLWEMGVLEGMWRCSVCGYRWYDTAPPSCIECGSDSILYAEVPIDIAAYNIKGHADGIVNLEGKRSLLEIKTIGLGTIRMDYPKMYKPYQEGTITLDQLWSSIKAPFPVHVRQAMLYLHGRRLDGDDLDNIIFIYEFKANQAVKAFTVGYKQDHIASILRGAAEVKDAVEQGVSVRRPVWATDEDNKTCKECPYRKTCWHLTGEG